MSALVSSEIEDACGLPCVLTCRKGNTDDPPLLHYRVTQIVYNHPTPDRPEVRDTPAVGAGGETRGKGRGPVGTLRDVVYPTSLTRPNV